MGTYNRWTDNEITRLKAMAAEGRSAPEIGTELGRSSDTIRNKAKKLGLKLKRAKIIGGQRGLLIDRRARDSRGEQAKRTCLSCGNTFKSEHKGNRRCNECKSLEVADGGGEFYFWTSPLQGRQVSSQRAA